MSLGPLHEGTRGVDDLQAPPPEGFLLRGGGPVGPEDHDVGVAGDLFDRPDAFRLEPLHHERVVDQGPERDGPSAVVLRRAQGKVHGPPDAEAESRPVGNFDVHGSRPCERGQIERSIM